MAALVRHKVPDVSHDYQLPYHSVFTDVWKERTVLRVSLADKPTRASNTTIAS